MSYDYADLTDLYLHQELSMGQIATLKGCPKSSVRAQLHRRGIPVRTSQVGQKLLFDKRYRCFNGAQSPHWKGGRIYRHGYVAVKIFPDNPYYNMATDRGRGYVMEHRLVMAQHLGRSLLPSEKVHHINGLQDDNRWENLKLVSPADHNLYTELCARCPLRKEIRLLRWEMKQLVGQLQGRLLGGK